MLPCAIEYFQTTTKHLPVGRHVGLRGSALERLTAAREGMPTYVWPTKPMIEHDLLRAGMSALTDHADPSLTWLLGPRPLAATGASTAPRSGMVRA